MYNHVFYIYLYSFMVKKNTTRIDLLSWCSLKLQELVNKEVEDIEEGFHKSIRELNSEIEI